MRSPLYTWEATSPFIENYSRKINSSLRPLTLLPNFEIVLVFNFSCKLIWHMLLCSYHHKVHIVFYMALNVPKHLLLITADYHTNVTVTCLSRCSLLITGRVASAGGARQDPGGYQREDGLHHEQGVPGRGVHHGERRAPQCSAAGGGVRDL